MAIGFNICLETRGLCDEITAYSASEHRRAPSGIRLFRPAGLTRPMSRCRFGELPVSLSGASRGPTAEHVVEVTPTRLLSVPREPLFCRPSSRRALRLRERREAF